MRTFWIVCAAISVLLFVATIYWIVYASVRHDIGVPLTSTDFSNLWLGARLALADQLHILFDHDAYMRFRLEAVGDQFQQLSWSYPPHALLLLTPLGLLEISWALAAFLTISFAMFCGAAILFFREMRSTIRPTSLAAALCGYVLLMVWTTQNGFLTAAFLLVALAWMYRRPAVAGCALALLSIKPQLAFLVPVLALIERNWRFLGWSAAFLLVLVATSMWTFGLQPWRDFVGGVLPHQRDVMMDWSGLFLRMMPTVFGSLRSLGVPSAAALAAQVCVSVLTLMVALWLWARARERLPRAYVLLAATLLISPYAFSYDMGALSVAAALMAVDERARAHRAASFTFAFVAVACAFVSNLGRSNLPITPLLLAGSLLAVWRVYVAPPSNTSTTDVSA